MKNIVLLIVDALRPKNLSLYGYEKETDPNLKKIAKEGILFKNHFSTSNCTSPSVTSILTGKYPHNHGILHQLPYTMQEEIEKIEKTRFWLPEYLKTKGYNTLAMDWIGLWFKRGFDYYDEGKKVKKGIPFNSADFITDLAISKIKNSKKPFFLLLHYWDTHFPFHHTYYEDKGNEEDMEKTLNEIKDEKQKEYLRSRISGKNLYTLQGMKEKYDLSIKNVDGEIGRFCDFLKQEDLWDNSIIIIVGDHGVNLASHEIYFSPSGLFDDSIHCPLIMHIPGIESKEIQGFVQNIDILPTIFEHLKFETQEKIDGKSALPLIEKSISIRDKIFAQDGLSEDIRTVRTKNKKLILSKDNFCNLCEGSHHKNIEEYDLEKDPEETTNIYSEKSELMKFLE